MTRRVNRAATPPTALGARPLGRGAAFVSDSLISGLLVAPFLAGCATGGGRSAATGGTLDPATLENAQNTFNQEPTEFRVLSGKAINGYLDLALVYVDLNQDGMLSAGEPHTVSREGNFSMVSNEGSSVVVAALQSLSGNEKAVANEQLLALGIDLNDAPQTSYESDGVQKVFSGRLEANVADSLESLNVTPLTSFSASLQRASGLSSTEADKLVQEKFGANPAEDYVSTGNTTAQKMSQAVSDFYQIAYASLESDSPSQLTSDSLTQRLLETANSLPSSASIGQLLSSPVDLRSVLLLTASDLQRELDISSVSLKLNDSFQGRDLDVPEPLVSLRFDTGLSQLDGVTSNPAIRTAELADPQAQWTYGVSVKSAGASESSGWSDIQWTDADPTENLLEGTYRIYVRDSVAQESDDLSFVELTLDKTAPIGAVAVGDVFNPSKQSHFEDYIPGFLNSLTLSNEYLDALQSEVAETEVLQYFVSTDGNVSHSHLAWNSGINIYSVPDQERGFYLSTRILDLAGNTSAISTAAFRIDQLNPLIPDVSAVKVESDSGIYNWDNYSKTISLEDLYLSLRLGESPDDHALLYVVSPGDERKVDISEALSFDALEDGFYHVDFRQVDRADNFSQIASFHFVLDRVAPDIDVTQINWVSSEYSKPHRDGGATNTFDEWGQYGYHRVDSEAEVVWLDFGKPEENGEYDIQFRFVDRAGNFSEEIRLGRHDLRPALLELSEQQTINLLSILSSDSATEAEISSWLALTNTFERFSLQTDFSLGDFSDSTTPSVVRRGLSLSAGALSSGALETSSLIDLTDRQELSFGLENFYSSAIEGEATEFLPRTSEERSSVILLGDSESDRFSDLRPGDIFLGAGGVDIAAASSSFKPLGLAFFSEAEKESLRSLVDGLPLSTPSRDQLDGAYMVYLGQEGTGDEGIAISNAEAFIYQNLKEEFLTTHYNERLDRLFFVHNASDNEFFYGGVNTGALGLGGSDLLLGGSGDDFLVAGSAPYGGEDAIYGHAGNDVLVGGDYQTNTFSKYTLSGGVGDDSLIMGNGLGVAEGGPGRDTFHVAPIPGSGAEMSLTIRDFSPSEDKVIFHFEGVNSLLGGVFILRDSEEVVVDLTQMFLGQGSAERTASSLDSLLRIQVDGMGAVDVETVLEEWFFFEGANSQIWSDLSDGWVALA